MGQEYLNIVEWPKPKRVIIPLTSKLRLQESCQQWQVRHQSIATMLALKIGIGNGDEVKIVEVN